MDRADLETPYYLIDERKLLKNLEVIRYVRDHSGAKCLLALKCFSTWAVFGLMRRYMDGTTSSSLFEARLGHEEFGKETHAYSVAFSDPDIARLVKFSDKIIFNSVSQLERFYPKVRGLKVGLRVNPGLSYSHFDLADPARKCSKLGETDPASVMKAADKISGVMFHYNCENNDFSNFSALLDRLGRQYKSLLEKLEWVSLGGGFYFTQDSYPYKRFAAKLKEFSGRHRVQVYLEPGEAAITQAGTLVVSVQDIIKNKADIAVVDSSVEAHALDLLIYRQPAKIEGGERGKYKYIVAGKSCLAGDIFGTFRFKSPLKVGSVIRFADAAGYTMVKKNWFNGLQMPSIVVKRLNGRLERVKKFTYEDFKGGLS
ncbi:MAG: carboxynorspermidine decarboxylase [Elusimicrobia bacterium RIFCSPLOWO2_01_FULL_60_11]|nr:MAG: carboxynorspermidine decarboxylase [Elusimicrobia bacterium RIFCSPLOWO2_01_FULL_60_11]